MQEFGFEGRLALWNTDYSAGLALSSDYSTGLAAMPNLRLTEPLGYLEFLNLMANARLVLTDSGGIQEETTILGVPLRQPFTSARLSTSGGAQDKAQGRPGRFWPSPGHYPQLRCAIP